MYAFCAFARSSSSAVDVTVVFLEDAFDFCCVPAVLDADFPALFVPVLDPAFDFCCVVVAVDADFC